MLPQTNITALPVSSPGTTGQTPNTFAQTLRELRLAAGLGLRPLARAAHVDFSTISKLEHGRRPSPDVAQALDDALQAGGRLVATAPPAKVRPENRPPAAVRVRTLRPGWVVLSADGVDFPLQTAAALTLMSQLAAEVARAGAPEVIA
ncbi:helix-turn-helix domain-containing protein [Cryptosporangium arvum]|uniref:Putative transcriptional regulator n=1 Tax=Cryptosporangium arvum DSM 44712 TaxID=927661 RepID=A0A010ZMX0_9ACTN|nr:helix-turn-helix transcriptional regulator [Cryptosporangium arvum]EXG80034.1 putative transcriptional regulator [Cryptosporangium arvum DSM 44712]